MILSRCNPEDEHRAVFPRLFLQAQAVAKPFLTKLQMAIIDLPHIRIILRKCPHKRICAV